jgi:hypothetical protein
MTLPDNFSAWEHLQSVILASYNKEVRHEFSDVGDDDWAPDITTPRASLRVACTSHDNDSILQTFMRMMLFYFVLRKASDLQAPIYGIPTEAYQQSVKFLPQVKLYFVEDASDVERGYAPIDAEITFRIPNETSESMTEAKARTIANKINSVFGVSNGYRWKKGRLKASYKDSHNGYNMIISAFSESEAREVLHKVLEIQNDTLNDAHLTISTLQQNPPTIPATERIYGESRRLPRRRPIGYVRFRYAELHLWAMPNAITLVDLSRRRLRPLVRA